MNMNGGFDPIVLHGINAVPNAAQARQTEEALQQMIARDKMMEAAKASAQPGQTDEIPLLTEAIKSGAMDSELDDLEEAISFRRNQLDKAGRLFCPECGGEGADDPWDCENCISDGIRWCKFPEMPDDKTMKDLHKWRWQYEQDETARQLAELRKEYGLE